LRDGYQFITRDLYTHFFGFPLWDGWPYPTHLPCCDHGSYEEIPPIGKQFFAL
jgi:hypothetical protein